MRVRLGIVAVLVVVAGCSTTVAGAPEEATKGTEVSKQADVPKRPKDRDITAVTAALRQIDACALISPQAGTGVGYPAGRQPTPEGPHLCVLRAGEPNQSDEVVVALGKQFAQGARFAEVPAMIGTTKAYLNTISAGRPGGSCEVHIPVSFERAVQVHAKANYGTNSDTCAQAKAFAAGVVEKLGNPDSVVVDPAKRPLAAWDACGVLAAALGDEAAGMKLTPSFLGDEGIDNCSAIEKAGTKPSGSTYDTVRVDIDYSPDPAKLPGKQPKQISGRQVMMEQRGTNCQATWSAAPTGLSEDFAHAVVRVEARDCAKAEAVTVKVMTILGGVPPQVAPQRPILLGPNDPDSPAIGACADFAGTLEEQCVPAHEVKQLPPKDKLLEAATKDQAISCAVAKEAVRQRFEGAELVVYGEHCYFVVLDHSVLIEMTLSSRYRPESYGTGAGTGVRNRKTVTVAGRPGVSFDSGRATTGVDYEVYVSLVGDTAKPGMLNGVLSFHPPRGSKTDAQADVSRANLLEPIMVDILQKYF